MIEVHYKRNYSSASTWAGRDKRLQPCPTNSVLILKKSLHSLDEKVWLNLMWLTTLSQFRAAENSNVWNRKRTHVVMTSTLKPMTFVRSMLRPKTLTSSARLVLMTEAVVWGESQKLYTDLPRKSRFQRASTAGSIRFFFFFFLQSGRTLNYGNSVNNKQQWSRT